MNFNFIKVATASPKVVVADCKYNTKQIIECIEKADKEKVEILVFPELSITGATCQDLFHQQLLQTSSLKGLKEIVEFSKNTPILLAIGLPILSGLHLYNCAALIQEGEILGIIPKTYLANSNESYEKRWFTSSMENQEDSISILGQDVAFNSNIVFQAKNNTYLSIGVEIGSDSFSPLSPSINHSLVGANIILHLQSINETANSYKDNMRWLAALSSRTKTAYLSAASGPGESTTDLVYTGHSYIYEAGKLIKSSKRFPKNNSLTYSLVDLEKISLVKQKDSLFKDTSQATSTKPYDFIEFKYSPRNYDLDIDVHPFPFIPKDKTERDSYCKETLKLQALGLAKRLDHIGLEKVVIGISGGLDSTLALIVCIKAFQRLGLDPKGIIGVTMPGFGTTDRTYNNSLVLMEKFSITTREISIVDASLLHFKDIGHDINVHDITYENTQARERTQILMNIANQVGGIVIGTGDLSEIALGWSTYNGDHMSMYAVNSGVPKTLIKHLIKWSANNEFEKYIEEVLLDILGTPVSPELLPPSKEGTIDQKTEESVGPYELVDFFLYYTITYGFSPEKIAILTLKAFKGKYDYKTINKWLKSFYRRFLSQQFKRSCLPDGPKVGPVGLSPRGDWKMPSDASYNLWLSSMND